MRALYDWLVDSEFTPYLLVGVDSDSVQVPRDYVSDGKIVLNISPQAVRDLQLGEDAVSFSGRFGGRPFPVRVPLPNVLAIYARETGEGMVFEPEYDGVDDGPDPEPPGTGGPGHLKVVK